MHPIASDAISLLLTHGITLTALVPLGAAVKGCDLRNKPSEEVLQALQSVMATRGFLVFKEQGVLSGDERVRASEFWGGSASSTHGVTRRRRRAHLPAVE